MNPLKPAVRERRAMVPWAIGLGMSALLGCGGNPGPSGEVAAPSESPINIASTPAVSASSASSLAPSAQTKSKSDVEPPVIPAKPDSTSAISDLVILPGPEDTLVDSGPLLPGVAIEVEGETFCGKDQLRLGDIAVLAVRAKDQKVYLVDNAEVLCAAVFANRKERLAVRVRGTPILKDGQIHLSAAEVTPLR